MTTAIEVCLTIVGAFALRLVVLKSRAAWRRRAYNKRLADINSDIAQGFAQEARHSLEALQSSHPDLIASVPHRFAFQQTRTSLSQLEQIRSGLPSAQFGHPAAQFAAAGVNSDPTRTGTTTALTLGSIVAADATDDLLVAENSSTVNESNALPDSGSHSDQGETLLRYLKANVIDQDEAVNSIVDTMEEFWAGLAPSGRPIGNFLFLGPTGVGKTRLVEVLAAAMVKNEKAVVKIDCAEFQHSHEIAKLIGSPPGYLGHRETHPLLSQERLNAYHTDTVKVSFVLFDEIEKASDSVWNLLLGILDKGILTLGDNRQVDFSRALVFMTANLGAREMASQANKPGFIAPDTSKKNLESIGVDAAKKRFLPEFWNRIDTVCTFGSLSEEAIDLICNIELRKLQEQLIGRFSLRLTPSAKKFIVTNGFDPVYGARYLKRTLRRLLIKPLARLIARGTAIKSNSLIIASLSESGEKLEFKIKR